MGDVYFYSAHDVVVLAIHLLVHFPIQEGVVGMQSWQGRERLVQEGNLDISAPVLPHWADALTDGVTWINAEQVGLYQEILNSPMQAHNQQEGRRQYGN